MESYAAQAGSDEISIYKSAKELAEEGADPNIKNIFDTHIAQIRSTLRRHGMPLKPERSPLYHMAKEVGMEKEYDALYGIYSKYVHASAWFVLRKREHTDLPSFRYLMQIHSQLYASMILKQLENIRDGKI